METKPKTPKYREGDWVAIPLDTGGYALGRIARKRGARLLVYAFCKRFLAVPILADTVSFGPKDAIQISRTGNPGIKIGTWHVIGQGTSDWKTQRSQWPMPPFRTRDLVTEGWIKVVYSNDSFGEGPVYRSPISEDEARQLYEDGGIGFLYFERLISRKIDRIEEQRLQVLRSIVW